MKSVREALETILENTDRLSWEKVFLFEAVGMVSAEDITSPFDIPPYDNSAMDGYALKFKDTLGASRDNPVRLRIIGEVKAGDYPEGLCVNDGEAVKIMTGGIIPEGADAVVEVEETKEDNGEVLVFKEVGPGKHVRRRGESVKKGEVIVKAGDTLTPGRVGLIASVGKSYVSVYRRPVVGILVTGDEVVDVDEPAREGSIKNSNTYSLYALSKEAGAVPVSLGIVKDDPETLKARFRETMESVDILLTTGGVSMGEYDYVRRVLEEVGIRLVFWKVSMKPGKPLVFGTCGKRLFFGLPGNPVSCMVSFELFVKPAIKKLMGKRDVNPMVIKAVLQEDIPRQKDGRVHFARVVVKRDGERFSARLAGEQGSGILKSMAVGNGLAVIPPGDGFIRNGDVVDVILLDDGVLSLPLNIS